MAQQRSTSDAILDNMVFAAAMATIDCARRRAAASALHVSLSGNGDRVTFPLAPGAAVPLESTNRIEVRHDGNGCAIYLDSARIRPLNIGESITLGPMCISAYRTRQDAEANRESLVRHAA